MKSVSARKKCYFTNSAIADLVFILMRIFNNEEMPISLQNVYTEDYINGIKEKYRFAGEIITSLPSKGYEMLEFLLNSKNFNNMQEYKDLVMKLEDEEFFYIFYGQYVDRALIGSALQRDECLNILYSKYNSISSNYLALKSLFFNKKLFLKELFLCLEELNTKKFIEEYEKMTDYINNNYQKVEAELEVKDPLEFSESIMGKTFKNRGPYQEFIFIPSYLVPGRAVRFFGEDQILIYSPEFKEFSKKDITKVLKIISDDTRFEIIELLSKNNSMNGKELANAVKLSTPTISHHIEQLKEAGFINEERVKNSKYYSINSNSVKEFIKYLSSTLNNIK
ncbi:MAG: metalloregulator ArsR/SmtB family transcription factor [Clostridiaceae bacterium]